MMRTKLWASYACESDCATTVHALPHRFDLTIWSRLRPFIHPPKAMVTAFVRRRYVEALKDIAVKVGQSKSTRLSSQLSRRAQCALIFAMKWNPGPLMVGPERVARPAREKRHCQTYSFLPPQPHLAHLRRTSSRKTARVCARMSCRLARIATVLRRMRLCVPV